MSKRKSNQQCTVRFEYIRDIDDLNEVELAGKGFYRGFVCPHGHNIRHIDDHWCYHCAKKIFSNVCGIDVNYIHPAYKLRTQSFLSLIEVKSFKECWEPESGDYLNDKRYCMHSYRSHKRQRMENMTPAKIVYHAAWGDVGALTVTRTCGNLNCFNPLHMRSDFNVQINPKTMYPVEFEFKYDKLMVAGNADANGQVLETLMLPAYKNTIKSPTLMKDEPE